MQEGEGGPTSWIYQGGSQTARWPQSWNCLSWNSFWPWINRQTCSSSKNPLNPNVSCFFSPFSVISAMQDTTAATGDYFHDTVTCWLIVLAKTFQKIVKNVHYFSPFALLVCVRNGPKPEDIQFTGKSDEENSKFSQSRSWKQWV